MYMAWVCFRIFFLFYLFFFFLLLFFIIIIFFFFQNDCPSEAALVEGNSRLNNYSVYDNLVNEFRLNIFFYQKR